MHSHTQEVLKACVWLRCPSIHRPVKCTPRASKTAFDHICRMQKTGSEKDGGRISAGTCGRGDTRYLDFPLREHQFPHHLKHNCIHKNPVVIAEGKVADGTPYSVVAVDTRDALPPSFTKICHEACRYFIPKYPWTLPGRFFPRFMLFLCPLDS